MNRTYLLALLPLLVLYACDGGGTLADSGTAPIDSGASPSDSGASPSDSGAAMSDSGTAMSDSGTAMSDAGAAESCPCFGATEIAAIEAHATAGGERGCMTGIVSPGAVSAALSSSLGAQVLQVTAQTLDASSGTQYICASGCSDTNDDKTDDCEGATLPDHASMIVTQAQHDACEALIAAACE